MSKQKQKDKKKLEKKSKQEETKKILALMKNNQISSTVLESLDSIQTLSKKQKKKVKLDTQEIQEEEKPLVVNIFAQNFSQTLAETDKIEEKIVERDLELQIKQLIPDLSLNEYNKKVFDKYENQGEIKEEEESSEEEKDIEHDILAELLKKQTKLFKHEVKRSKEQEEQREALPIYMRENEIIDMVNSNIVSIISGQTGCGKSTQVPQFLYEYGYGHPQGYNPGMIGITQPRRIAAITLAKRLSQELNSPLGELVAYQVRHEASKHSENTKIKFQTDGILMNEMISDFLLTKYSVIIIDEAHERKINSDLLLGILSRVVSIRAKMAAQNPKFHPLRLIIMSATLSIEELTENKELFKNKVPCIDVETRQFPVQIFYDKRTEENYLEQAIKKSVKIHEKLPPGNVLVFLTGELEIKQFCYQLNKRLENYDCDYDDESDNEQLDDTQENNPDHKEVKDPNQKIDYKILPLYSKLTSEQQNLIFQQQNINTRVIVAATNVAETSLTIPGIKYVIDCGKQKRKLYSKNLQIMRFEIDWVSQASANQRAGRAGRLGPGICYRLFSTAIYSNYFDKHTQPELIVSPLEPTILSLYSIGVKDPKKFPFPTKPPNDSIELAIRNLQNLKLVKNNVLTELGQHVSVLPIAPKFGKLLLLSRAYSGIGFALLLVSVLSVEELVKTEKPAQRKVSHSESENDLSMDSDGQDGIKREIRDKQLNKKQFNQDMDDKRENIKGFKAKYAQFMQESSDIFLRLNLLGHFMKHLSQQNLSYQQLDQEVFSFSNMHNLHPKSLKETYNNLQQLTKILSILLQDKREFNPEIFFKNYQSPNSQMQYNLIGSLCNIFIDNVAKKTTLYNPKTNRPYQAYITPNLQQPVYIPQTSVLYQKSYEYILFTHMTFNGYNQRYYIQNGCHIPDAKILYENDYSQPPLKMKKNYHFKGTLMDTAESSFKGWTLEFSQEVSQDLEGWYGFAKCLLKGQIFQDLQKLKWKIDLEKVRFTNLDPKLAKFVNTLKSVKTFKKEGLQEGWRKNAQFLFEEMQALVHTHSVGQLTQIWPPKK